MTLNSLFDFTISSAFILAVYFGSENKYNSIIGIYNMKPEQLPGLRLAAGCCSVLKVTLRVFEQDNEFICQAC